MANYTQKSTHMAARSTATTSDLGDFLRSYDTSGSGKFDRDRWLYLCSSASINLPQESAAHLFDRLDTDHDGIVTISELLKDLTEWQSSLGNGSDSDADVNESWKPVDMDRFAFRGGGQKTTDWNNKRMDSFYESTPDELDDDFGKSVEDATRLSRIISDSYPELASSFHQLLATFKKDILAKKAEKETLEHSYEREKQARKQDLERLEKELDAQIQMVEEKLREEIGQKYEAVYQEKVRQKELETRHYQETVQDLKQQVHANYRRRSNASAMRAAYQKSASGEDNVFSKAVEPPTGRRPGNIAHDDEEYSSAIDKQLQKEAMELRKKLNDAQVHLKASEAELEQLRATIQNQSSALHIEKLRASNFIEEKNLLYEQIMRLRATFNEVHGKHAALQQQEMHETAPGLQPTNWRRDSGQWSGSNEISERHHVNMDPADSVISGWSNLDHLGTPDRIFRIIMVGDPDVGKTCFLHRFCSGEFFHNTKATIGVDFKTKNMMIDGIIYAFEIWDTAGCEKFRSIAKNYFRKCDGAILMYDVSNRDSFLGVRDWVNMLEENTGEVFVPRIIVANKIDLRDGPSNSMKPSELRFVATPEGDNLAKLYKAEFLETSVLNYLNVDETIVNLARCMKFREDCQGSGIKITKQKPKFKAMECCK